MYVLKFMTQHEIIRLMYVRTQNTPTYITVRMHLLEIYKLYDIPFEKLHKL